MVVLDTSALIYWTLDPGRLSSTAHGAIENADRLVVSAISIWEIGIKAKRGRLDIHISIEKYADRLEQLDKLEILPVDVKTWLENLSLEWEHRDPADRTIVATARLLNSPLVTSDEIITRFYIDTIW
jgi:PIN domain nuclease of toxin-antitoxin system